VAVPAIADIASAELDFEGGDYRRGRSRRAPTPRIAAERAAPDRHGARPARREKRTGDDRPRDRAPGEREAPARLRRDTVEPAVALFAKPAAKPSAEPRNPPPPEERVVGFGDDLPAFLARAPRVAVRA
jgi:hypothetical protein